MQLTPAHRTRIQGSKRHTNKQKHRSSTQHYQPQRPSCSEVSLGAPIMRQGLLFGLHVGVISISISIIYIIQNLLHHNFHVPLSTFNIPLPFTFHVLSSTFYSLLSTLYFPRLLPNHRSVHLSVAAFVLDVSASLRLRVVCVEEAGVVEGEGARRTSFFVFGWNSGIQDCQSCSVTRVGHLR